VALLGRHAAATSGFLATARAHGRPARCRPASLRTQLAGVCRAPRLQATLNLAQARRSPASPLRQRPQACRPAAHQTAAARPARPRHSPSCQGTRAAGARAEASRRRRACPGLEPKCGRPATSRWQARGSWPPAASSARSAPALCAPHHAPCPASRTPAGWAYKVTLGRTRSRLHMPCCAPSQGAGHLAIALPWPEQQGLHAMMLAPPPRVQACQASA